MGNLPDWLNFLTLLILAIITGLYARSTRDMATVMRETYELESSPQLICTVEALESIDDDGTNYPLQISEKRLHTLNLAPGYDHIVPCEFKVLEPQNPSLKIEFFDFKQNLHVITLSLNGNS